MYCASAKRRFNTQALLVGCILMGMASAVQAQRQPNTSLRLPAQPPAYGYTLVEAFPGLTFAAPMVLTSPPGETNQLFVADRPGRIYAIANLAAPSQTLVLDLSSVVEDFGEGGLLGLTFHPGYATNRFFFVFYTLWTTTTAGTGYHDRVSRFEISPSHPFTALRDSEQPLLTQFSEAANHNAGDIAFGPDGYLYVATGDEGGANDIFGNSRRIDRDFFGAILRLDVDERPGSLAPNPHPAIGSGYAIPADNPFVGTNRFNGAPVDPNRVRTEFWAVGFRNPWRMTFDPSTGWLFVGDVGQASWEEINHVVAGGDYGWNYREGRHPFRGTPPAGVSLTDPIWEYPHLGGSSSGGFSVTGGVVYRGTRFAQLYGHYIFADWVSGNVWAFLYDGTTASNHRLLTTRNWIAEFGTDPANGDILVGTTDGGLYRLVYNEAPVGEPLPPTLADTGAFRDLLSLEPEAGILPYDVNLSFWSDHAIKSRWFSVPDTNQFLQFLPDGQWSSPTGTVWIKHFELELTRGVPSSRRRLETRFLVRSPKGTYGITYRWDDTQTNALLVPEAGMDETLLIREGALIRTQVWQYPARAECQSCHALSTGPSLGFTTAQLNRASPISGPQTNQILALADLGYFRNPPTEIDSLPAFATPEDNSATLEHRVRSYLDVNCAYCHQPGAAARGLWDARSTTPLLDAGILNGPLLDNRGDPNLRVVACGSPDHSMLLRRVTEPGPGHMPPLATSELNQDAAVLLRDWILSQMALSISRPADGPPLLTAQGAPHQAYQLEHSPSVQGWLPLDQLLTGPDGTATYPIGSEIVSNQANFYRLRRDPP